MSDYTLIQSGDANAAENVGALAGTLAVNRIVDGLGLSNYDAGTPSIDVAAGKTAHVLETATAEWTLDDGTQRGEQREQVLVVCHLDAQAGVALDDGAVNHLFVEPNWSTDDSPQLVTNTTGAKPSADALKIGEVDTSNDTTSEQWALVADDGALTFPTETAIDAAVSRLSQGTRVTDRATDTQFVVTGSGKAPVQKPTEQVQDDVGAMAGTGLDYDDAANALNVVVSQSVEASETDDGSDITTYRNGDSGTILDITGSGTMLGAIAIADDQTTEIDVTVDGGTTYTIPETKHNQAALRICYVPPIKFDSSLKLTVYYLSGGMAVVKQ